MDFFTFVLLVLIYAIISIITPTNKIYKIFIFILSGFILSRITNNILEIILIIIGAILGGILEYILISIKNKENIEKETEE